MIHNLLLQKLLEQTIQET